MATWLALVALLLQAAVAGFHMPLAQAAVAPSHQELCAPDQPGDGSAPAGPLHGFQHCPFCLTLQGGKLLPPTVCLVFPPQGMERRLGLPPSDLAPALAPVPPATPARGPPLPA